MAAYCVVFACLYEMRVKEHDLLLISPSGALNVILRILRIPSLEYLDTVLDWLPQHILDHERHAVVQLHYSLTHRHNFIISI